MEAIIMRQYQPAWEALKERMRVQLKADPDSHSRIYRAIRKEKFKDIPYKLLCESQGKLYLLKHESEADVLTLYLIPDTSIKNL